MRDTRRPSLHLELLAGYVERLQRGERVDKSAVLEACPADKCEELLLAMKGADLVERVARDVRAAVAPQARRRALAKIRQRLAL